MAESHAVVKKESFRDYIIARRCAQPTPWLFYLFHDRILLEIVSGIKERYEKTNCVNSLISEILNSFAKDGYSKDIKIANV